MIFLKKIKKSRYYGKFINAIGNGLECCACSASCTNIYSTSICRFLNIILALNCRNQYPLSYAVWLRQCYNYGLLLIKMPFYYIEAGDLYAHYRSLLFLRFVLAVCEIFFTLRLGYFVIRNIAIKAYQSSFK